MTRYLVRRTLRAAITIFTVMSLVFWLGHLAGDPAQWLMPDGTPAQQAMLARQLGLDHSFLSQYVSYVGGLFHGNFGRSWEYQQPVSTLFAQRAPKTLELGLIALVLSVGIGVPAGVFAATRRGAVVDRLLMTFAVSGDAVPDFALGIILILVFSLTIRIFPSGGFSSWSSVILPVVTLAAAAVAGFARWTRSSMIDALAQDHLDTARSKGIGERKTITRHAVRNALIPVVTIVGMQLGTLLGGAVVVETVFAWPGIGSLIVTAAQYRDVPVIEFGVIVIATTVTVTSLLVDIGYAVIDPRVRVHA